MKAIWNGVVIAESDRTVQLEGNHYFPRASVKAEYLIDSPTRSTCPWKGVCQYFDVGEGENWSQDNAWSYPNPMPSAIERVHKDFSNYVAFWRDVTVTE